MNIRLEYLLTILKSDTGVIGFKNTERTGFIGSAVLMVMKDRGKNGKTECNQQNGSKLSEIGAGQPHH